MYIKDDNIELADNDEIQEEVTSPEPQPTSPVDQTKAFAKRLKEETEKARLSEREEIAKSFGYNSWKEYSEEVTKNKLLDKGLDPETVRPVLEDLIKNNPEYVEAMKYKAEKEELEKKLFASSSIQSLNNTFGTAYASLDELDADTIKMFNEGTPLEKAFAANNWTKLQELAVKKVSSKDNGKSHLTNLEANAKQSETKEYNKTELDVFNSFGISAERANEWKKSHNKK